MVLGKVRALAINFDTMNENNLPVFSGGELVSGRVIVDVTGDLRVKSLDLVAKGIAKVRWTESRNAGANTSYAQNYTEEVEYLHHYDTLIGEERDEDCPEEGLTVLHAGLHEFAFSFNLPQMALATSFEGKHGNVRYWVKAELHRPWLLPVRVKKEFIVFEHIDINTPLLLAPQAGTKEKTLCCWFCASGPISLSAKIERKGYTPGECIQIFADVENCSSRVVVPKAALYQNQTFFAKGKGKQIQQLVSNLRGDPLPQGKSQSWEGKLLKIPPVSPSILDCPIIKVEYALVSSDSMGDISDMEEEEENIDGNELTLEIPIATGYQEQTNQQLHSNDTTNTNEGHSMEGEDEACNATVELPAAVNHQEQGSGQPDMGGMNGFNVITNLVLGGGRIIVGESNSTLCTSTERNHQEQSDIKMDTGKGNCVNEIEDEEEEETIIQGDPDMDEINNMGEVTSIEREEEAKELEIESSIKAAWVPAATKLERSDTLEEDEVKGKTRIIDLNWDKQIAEFLDNRGGFKTWEVSVQTMPDAEIKERRCLEQNLSDVTLVLDREVYNHNQLKSKCNQIQKRLQHSEEQLRKLEKEYKDLKELLESERQAYCKADEMKCQSPRTTVSYFKEPLLIRKVINSFKHGVGYTELEDADERTTACSPWIKKEPRVYVDIPGGLNLSLSLPLVIGTIPLHAGTSRTSSISSNCSTMTWLGLSETPEAPPSYSDLRISESHRRDCLRGCNRSEQEEEDYSALLTYITEFRYLPPPVYSEVDPCADVVEATNVSRPDTFPSR